MPDIGQFKIAQQLVQAVDLAAESSCFSVGLMAVRGPECGAVNKVETERRWLSVHRSQISALANYWSLLKCDT
jgi:hypothetical protein